MIPARLDVLALIAVRISASQRTEIEGRVGDSLGIQRELRFQMSYEVGCQD